MILRIAAAGIFLVIAPAAVVAEPAACGFSTGTREIAAALGKLRASVDPCGESAEMLAVLDRFERCRRARYDICVSTDARRNLFDRRNGLHGASAAGTITWNPELRSELEDGCDGDPARPLRRDPAASLLHEIVHAVDDCEGLEPGEHEIEAVRIENIYRRAAGLCQRVRYGDDPLPAEMVRVCAPGKCACTLPAAPAAKPVVASVSSDRTRAGDLPVAR